MEAQQIKEYIRERVEGNNDWTMFADGFDEAILGVDSSNERVIYSYKKCLEILMERDNMSNDEAIEFFAFNVIGSFMGEKTPIYCYDLF
jgi:hypothetical protein